MLSVRRDRFVRIAEARTNKIIHLLRLLSNCSNKATYDYSEPEVRKIFQAIELELKKAKTKFYNKNENKFSLK